MDLYSLKLEIMTLRALTDETVGQSRRMSLMGRLAPGHFATSPTKESFKRLRKLAQSDGELPSWDEFSEDPRLSSETRDVLNDDAYSDVSPWPSNKYKALLKRLASYLARRDLKALHEAIAEALSAEESEENNEDKIRELAAGKLASLGAGVLETKIYGFGKGAAGSGVKLAERVINEPAERMLKTGITEYDERNAGFPTAGVVLMGGTTSGGKSTVSMNVGHDMALLNGVKVTRFTLEMTAEQETNRYLSMVSGINFGKIKKKQLTPSEKKQLLAAANKVNDQLTKAGGSFNYSSPEKGMTMDEILAIAAATGSDVNIIDYIGLLSDIPTDAQAAALSDAVRKAKVHATATGKLYIILVQLDSDSGKVRYSRGMVEHADVLLTWSYVEGEVRAMHELPIVVAKARDGELFAFAHPEDFATMRTGSRAIASRARADKGDRESLRRVPAPTSSDDDDEDVAPRSSRPVKRPAKPGAKSTAKKPMRSGGGDRFQRKKPAESRGFGSFELGSGSIVT